MKKRQKRELEALLYRGRDFVYKYADESDNDSIRVDVAAYRMHLSAALRETGDAKALWERLWLIVRPGGVLGRIEANLMRQAAVPGFLRLAQAEIDKAGFCSSRATHSQGKKREKFLNDVAGHVQAAEEALSWPTRDFVEYGHIVTIESLKDKAARLCKEGTMYWRFLCLEDSERGRTLRTLSKRIGKEAERFEADGLCDTTEVLAEIRAITSGLCEIKSSMYRKAVKEERKARGENPKGKKAKKKNKKGRKS